MSRRWGSTKNISSTICSSFLLKFLILNCVCFPLFYDVYSALQKACDEKVSSIMLTLDISWRWHGYRAVGKSGINNLTLH